MASERFRLALVCFLAAAREDLRGRRQAGAQLVPNEVRTQLLPVLRREAGRPVPDADELIAKINERLPPAVERMTDWTSGERRFLGRLLDEGELEPEHLTSDAMLQERIHSQPMLQWKRKNVRKGLGLDPETEE